MNARCGPIALQDRCRQAVGCQDEPDDRRILDHGDPGDLAGDARGRQHGGVGSPSGCSGTSGSRRCLLPSSHAMIASESPMLMRHAHGGRISRPRVCSRRPQCLLAPRASPPRAPAARSFRRRATSQGSSTRARPGAGRASARPARGRMRCRLRVSRLRPHAGRCRRRRRARRRASRRRGWRSSSARRRPGTAVRRRGGACPPRRCRVSAIRGVRVVVLRRSTQVAVGVADTRVHVLGRRGPVDGRDRLRAQEHQLDGLDEVDVAIVERR